MNVVLFTDINGWYGLARYAGTYKIATELRNANYTCQTIDYFTNYSFKELKLLIEKFVSKDTLYVGFSTTLLTLESEKSETLDTEDLNSQCGQYYGCKLLPEDKFSIPELFAAIRSKNPKTKIVMGGSKVIYSQDYPGVDYWISGPADLSSVALADFLSGKSHSLERSENPNGSFTVYSKKNYSYQHFRTSRTTYVKHDFLDENESLPLEVSRGCAFNCAFCTFEKRENSLDYVKHPEHLRRELIDNYTNFGVTRYMLCDDTYNDSLEKVQIISDLFSDLPFKIEFTAYCRLDMLHAKPQMKSLLIDSGAKSIFFGIETLDSKAGAQVGKGLGREKTIRTVAELKTEWGKEIFTAGSFIIGLPGESEQSLNETIRWVHDDKPFDSWFWNLLMIRNRERLKLHDAISSPMALDPERYGITNVVENFKDWRHEHMTFGFAKEIQLRARGEQKNLTGNRLWTGHGWLNMMWNLDYTNSQCAEMTLSNIKKFDCLTRKNQKVTKYLDRLMNWEE